jgi:sugar-specific transcriptional regulator TrmB
VEQLKGLGLSTYAAETFVALVSLGDGTAQDVSDVSRGPRTRVYDAVEELQSRGLVDVRQSTPKRFWPISTETTSRHFEEEYSYRVDALRSALSNLESTNRSAEQRGVWTVTGHRTVTERVTELIENATSEIVFMTVDSLLSDEIEAQLRAANDRGVTIQFADMSASAETQLQDSLPEADLFDSMWNWADTPAGRLLMVDQEKTLVSVLVAGDANDPDEPRGETAIWGSGTENSLVVVLKALFTWELNGTRT